MGPRLRQLPARALPNGIVDLLRQIAFMAAAYLAYRLVRGAIDDPQGAAVAFDNARRLIAIEQDLHVYVEPGVQAWAARVPALMDVSSWIYINAQTSVTLGALAYLYLFHNASFYFVRNMFAVAFTIALAGYLVYPTAPPRFFPEWGFVDAVSQFAGVDHDDQVNSLFNPYAAVPSMHVAFALMIGVPLSRLVRARRLRRFWAMYPALVTFVIVATANHWIADAVLGAATAGAAAWAAHWLARARPAAWAFAPGPRMAPS
jgi:hypothetical protein